MSVSYGCTRTFGYATYSVEGYESHEAALIAVLSMAQDDGLWSPPKLREKPWQFWRPKEYTDIEKTLIACRDAGRTE